MSGGHQHRECLNIRRCTMHSVYTCICVHVSICVTWWVCVASRVWCVCVCVCVVFVCVCVFIIHKRTHIHKQIVFATELCMIFTAYITTYRRTHYYIHTSIHRAKQALSWYFEGRVCLFLFFLLKKNESYLLYTLRHTYMHVTRRASEAFFCDILWTKKKWMFSVQKYTEGD
jgi:hypothetical protein